MSLRTADRRNYLSSHYGFVCSCEACVERDTEGDDLRREVASLQERIADLIYYQDDEEEEEVGKYAV